MDQLFLSVVNHHHNHTDEPSQEHVINNENHEESKLEVPIPPLHVQQKYLNDSGKVYNDENVKYLRSLCSRCKKEFDQALIVPKTNEPEDATGDKPLVEPKVFKLCQHCRELQRQRSRRWQKKTKEKIGVCRRCGNDIPPELQKFVLCLNCRQNLRFRKANRAKQGRCVHCSGPLDTSIINNSEDGTERKEKNFKVCKRCRENDKIRRNNLEKMGNCNRCAKPLLEEDIGKHKVCRNCRNKKKKSNLTDSINPINGMVMGMGIPGHDQSMIQDMGIFNSYNQLQIQQQINQALQPQNPVPQTAVQSTQSAQDRHIQHPVQPMPVNLQQLPVYNDMRQLPIQVPIGGQMNQSPQGQNMQPQMQQPQMQQPLQQMQPQMQQLQQPMNMQSLQPLVPGSIPNNMNMPYNNGMGFVNQYQMNMVPQYQPNGQQSQVQVPVHGQPQPPVQYQNQM